MNKRQGITLVALVVTIIVLLMLVGITVAVVFGPDGTLGKAHDSKIAGRASAIRDRITVWLSNNEVKRKIGEAEEPIEVFLSKLKTEGLLTGDEIDSIADNSYNKLEIGKEKIYFTKTDPTWLEQYEIGDRVYYNPTEGATSNQLTYTSKKGSSKAVGDTTNQSGNGHSNQTFKATVNDCNWVVLSKKGGVLRLISENTKQTSTNEDLTMEGPTAYLYAEQELNNICSIYGHRTWVK